MSESIQDVVHQVDYRSDLLHDCIASESAAGSSEMNVFVSRISIELLRDNNNHDTQPWILNTSRTSCNFRELAFVAPTRDCTCQAI
jgi:hypothetical protein